MLAFTNLEDISGRLPPEYNANSAQYVVDPIADAFDSCTNVMNIDEKLKQLEELRKSDSEHDVLSMTIGEAIRLFKESNEKCQDLYKAHRDMKDKLKEIDAEKEHMNKLLARNMISPKLWEDLRNELVDKEIEYKAILDKHELDLSKHRNAQNYIRDFIRMLTKQLTEHGVAEAEATPIHGTCSICYVNPANHVMNPCGHTLCGECKNRQILQTCHICRANFIGIIKIFPS